MGTFTRQTRPNHRSMWQCPSCQADGAHHRSSADQPGQAPGHTHERYGASPLLQVSSLSQLCHPFSELLGFLIAVGGGSPACTYHRKKVMHRYGDDSFLASDSAHAQWSCELCTLLNPGTRRTCAACQGPRPLARPGTPPRLSPPPRPPSDIGLCSRDGVGQSSGR
jgi:hypothetical protein